MSLSSLPQTLLQLGPACCPHCGDASVKRFIIKIEEHYTDIFVDISPVDQCQQLIPHAQNCVALNVSEQSSISQMLFQQAFGR